MQVSKTNNFKFHFPGTLGDEVTNFGGATSGQSQKNKKRKSTPKKKAGGKKRKFV